MIEKKNESQRIPFGECKSVNIEKDMIYPVSNDSTSLFNLIKTFDQELEDETYLWPGKIVSDIFNIHMDFDFLPMLLVHNFWNHNLQEYCCCTT